MKKLFALLALLSLLFSCKINLNLEDQFRVSPTIKGYAYSFDSKTLDDADAQKVLSAVYIGKSKWDGKKGDQVQFQVQLNKDTYGGTPDKLEFNYYQEGTCTYESPTSVTLKINGNFTAINGTWTLTREDDGDKITLVNGSQTMKLKFWHEED